MKSFNFLGITFLRKPTCVHTFITGNEISLYADSVFIKSYKIKNFEVFEDEQKLLKLIETTFGDDK